MTHSPLRQVAAATALIAAVAALALPAAASTTPSTSMLGAALTPPVRGQDISWPECPRGMGIPERPTEGKPMPSSTAKFVIVGLTNGPAFTPNPCLAKQAAWVKAHHVYAAPYAVISYPSSAKLAKYGTKGPYKGSGLTARLRNVGWSQAQFNLAAMRRAGLSAPLIWADVEVPPTGPWSRVTSRNTAVLDGAVAGYRAAGIKIGMYTSRGGWTAIMGTARYGLPEWRTTGPKTQAAASKACTWRTIQGGKVAMTQWYTKLNDYDLLCPGYDTPAAMAAYFHKF